MAQSTDKKYLFESMPIPKALATMAIPTIISQLVNLVYNMVDAFFIGRTGNSYMMAATSLTLTMTMMNVAFSNLFGVGGGSLIARLMGMQKEKKARSVSAFCFFACIALALGYSVLLAVFLNPVLRFLGASDATIGYARQYTFFVIIIGSVPTILSLTLAHILRNAGYSSQASTGLSGGGILNMFLDPLFMFVILPRGYEVAGAAIATLLSNVIACIYLLYAFRKASETAPLSSRLEDAKKLDPDNRRNVFAVGIPSALLTGLFDLANICVNILSSAHSDLVLAAIGIVMKVERIPNAVNVGICQGMLPIVAYNFSSGDHERMSGTIRFARLAGLSISAVSILLLELLASPVTGIFLSTKSQDAETAAVTLAFAALFLRIRCVASPVQFINYNSSYCMQAMGFGKATMLHAFVRELIFYIPLMFTLDHFFGETGLACALPAGEGLGAVFALILLSWLLRRDKKERGEV
ncbi:MAG: MATE family efflux transporter [Lachnospiraceae bacterium]|nr:MATE family efflux transporter [Lachnospiraceae bacterium]